jgi:hypothetical protein
MKRLLSIFLVIAVVFAGAAIAAPLLISAPDVFVHGSPVQASLAAIPIVAPSFTIKEWCETRKYSRAEWYRMKARGDGPDTIGQGRMTRIPPDADARWLKAQERKAKQSKVAAA